MPALEARRLIVDELVLRPFTAGDEPAVAVALEDPDILRWTAGTAVLRTPAPKRAAKWLESRVDCWARGNAVFAITEAATDQVLGSMTLRDVHRIPDQAICAYWITPTARGRRIATRALDAAARWAFAQDGLALHRLSLDHALINEGSCRVATQAGFLLEGTMRDYYVEATGRRHDSHLHARLATDEGL